jgi:CRISPR-associated protein Csm5
MEKPLKIRLHVLSPVHIGCDDVYEPTSFVIDETKKTLIEFDPIDFITNLTPAQSNEFSKLCTGEDLLSIFKFVKRVYKNGNPLREIDVSSGLVEHYKKVLAMSSFNKNAIINQFTMNKTSYNPQTNQVYIPGTSVKGALRTAYLGYLASQRDIKGRKEKAKDLEIELLGGKFDTDPFRMVKVSDFQSLEAVRTKIVYGINKNKKVSDRETRAATGPQQIFEVIESGSVFEGAININTPEKTAGLKTTIEQTSLFEALNHHYRKLFDQEMLVVKDCGFRSISTSAFLDRLGKSCFLVRLGRHSGAEAVTIEGNRNIRIKQADDQPPKNLDQSTTIWLASEFARPTANNGLIPFGWAMLEVVPFDTTVGLFSRSSERKTKSDVAEKQTVIQTETAIEKPAAKKEPERITWSGATITYSPGNKTLIATFQNKKAELQIGDDRSIVPVALHKTLFEKRKGVQADIIIEPLGNAFRIVKVENGH